MYDVTIQCIVFLIYFSLLKETIIYFRWDNTQQFFFIMILKQFNRYSIISWAAFFASLQFILYYFICDIQIVKFVWNKIFFMEIVIILLIFISLILIITLIIYTITICWSFKYSCFENVQYIWNTNYFSVRMFIT